MKKFEQTATLVGLVLLIASCGGGGGSTESGLSGAEQDSGNMSGTAEGQQVTGGFSSEDPDIPVDTILKIGSVFFNQEPEDNQLYINASFSQANFYQNSAFELNPALSVCIYLGDPQFTASVTTIDGEPAAYESLSAGEVILISSKDGSYVDIERSVLEFTGDYFYSDPVALDLPLPVPQSLVVDIPGDEFPVFNAIPVPAIEPLEITVPEENLFGTPEATYQWVPSTSYSDFIAVTITDSESFENLVSCTLEDTGSATLPEDIQAKIQGRTLSVSLGRIERRFFVSGDALLQVRHSSTYYLGFR